MKRIYVAGSISDTNPIKTLHNIGKGLAMGAKLLRLGYAPFIPHMDFMLHFLLHNKPLTKVDLWYEYSLEWLKVSNAVLVLPNWKNSKGVAGELRVAEQWCVPICYSLKELKERI